MAGNLISIVLGGIWGHINHIVARKYIEWYVNGKLITNTPLKFILKILIPLFSSICAFIMHKSYSSLSLNCLIAFLFVTLLQFLAICDLMSMIIPNPILIYSFLFGMTLITIESHGTPWNNILGAVISFICYVFLYLFTRGSIGLGDVKLSVIIGLFIGADRILPALLTISICGAIHSLIVLILKSPQRSIPYVPSMALGSVIIFLFL